MNFKEAKALGDKAEDIIKNMFQECGWKVFRYGWEYTLPNLVGEKITGNAADYIRRMPDFILVNERNEVFFVEVKYRSNSEIKLDHIFNYPNCYVILVNKQGILGQSTKYLHEKRKDFTYLVNLPPFQNLPRDVIYKYGDKIKRTFGEETWIGQKIEGVVSKVVGKKFVKTPLKKAGVSVVKRTNHYNTGNVQTQRKRWRRRK